MAPTAGVKLKLGGKNRTLRYTNRALVELEDKASLTLGEFFVHAQAGSLKAVSRLVWAGLLHSDPELDYWEVVDMVDLSRLEEIAEAAGEALEAAFGKKNGKADEEGKADSKTG